MIEPPFRKAAPDDAETLAELVDMAGEGLPAYLWGKMAEPGETAWSVGRRRARRDEGSFSWRNAVMLDVDGQPVATLIGYPLPEAPEPIPADMPGMLRSRCSPSSWASASAIAARISETETSIATKLLLDAEIRVAAEPQTGHFAGSVKGEAQRLIGGMPADHLELMLSGGLQLDERLRRFADEQGGEMPLDHANVEDVVHRHPLVLPGVRLPRRDLFRRPMQPLDLKNFDGLCFDPPRAGAEQQCRELAKSKVQRIAAVSCNPTTLARDLRILIDGGYRLKSVTPIDQFLWSSHVEAVALLER